MQSRKDIVITDANKGGAVVKIDVEDQEEKEAEEQLNNKEIYKKIRQQPY